MCCLDVLEQYRSHSLVTFAGKGCGAGAGLLPAVLCGAGQGAEPLPPAPARHREEALIPLPLSVPSSFCKQTLLLKTFSQSEHVQLSHCPACIVFSSRSSEKN